MLPRMKTVFLIRGFGLNKTAADPDLGELRQMLRAQGFRVVPVSIPWNYKTLSQFVDEFVALYHQKKSDYNIVLGGSLGAMVALAATPKIVPDELMLCSLARYFAEDLGLERNGDFSQSLGKRRLKDFEKYSATSLIAQLNKYPTKTTYFYGELEQNVYPLLVAKIKERAALTTNARLIEIPAAGHKIREAAYISGLRKSLGSE